MKKKNHYQKIKQIIINKSYNPNELLKALLRLRYIGEKYLIPETEIRADIQEIYQYYGYSLIQNKINNILKNYNQRKYKNVFIRTIYKFFGIETNKKNKTRTEHIEIVNQKKEQLKNKKIKELETEIDKCKQKKEKIIVSKICKKLNISRQTYYNYIEIIEKNKSVKNSDTYINNIHNKQVRINNYNRVKTSKETLYNYFFGKLSGIKRKLANQILKYYKTIDYKTKGFISYIINTTPTDIIQELIQILRAMKGKLYSIGGFIRKYIREQVKLKAREKEKQINEKISKARIITPEKYKWYISRAEVLQEQFELIQEKYCNIKYRIQTIRAVGTEYITQIIRQEYDNQTRFYITHLIKV